jgi:tRNA (mo5U34)-methyltransferase
MRPEALLRRARELAPWHFDIELAPGVMTSSLNRDVYDDQNKVNVGVVDPEPMRGFFRERYPAGLAGKDVLDIGCNAGAYCLIAHEEGASSATGFDIHEHWIEQAEFLKSARHPQAKSLKFVVGDAKTFLAEDRSRKFDITIFKGVFYHLPDPIHFLIEACDATRELILVDTVSSDLVPEGAMESAYESSTHLMAGVDGLVWYPGGPLAVRRIMEYRGFTSFSTSYWRHDDRPGRGRFQIVGSRR